MGLGPEQTPMTSGVGTDEGSDSGFVFHFL